MPNCVKFNYSHKNAKGLVAKLAPPHAQSAWGSRGERVRAAKLEHVVIISQKKNLFS